MSPTAVLIAVVVVVSVGAVEVVLERRNPEAADLYVTVVMAPAAGVPA